MIITYLGGDKFRIKTREANITLAADRVDIDGFVINGPGEYERKNVFVEAPFEQPVFKILVEDVIILYPGKSKKFSDKQIEALDGVDLLFLPCGEEDSMSLKDALELSSTLEPGIIIPMLYSDIQLLKKEGLEGSVGKNAKITKASLPQEESEVIILEKV
ncbi:hypothetical protein AUJ40_00765 [Candidatus Berkelbacteria bacterium CG1_02_42_45]|uniref:Zn-dependent hydrolase n=3 Tax=Candidatus Berkelbacteria TaxID=1618330 RepID=A0A2H0B1Z9_9BACT|nr:MAG: hypothetical protein AUJ40_00765 [Candidatus Berkelbacteria bacterium CG1_02_42_45]PIP50938.1 MAG: hypothetical protein COX11_01400 [Candidatus Berkelbacteria bacterium CG23_combo_of_CG06-09_8_20_14_all_41_73]PIR27198.1 MAG: hypothetical protein COV40_02125 [Candidatus Berkelbacteria bacterium CG11_big_fil_rev_8_21_14_0_20_42_15]